MRILVTGAYGFIGAQITATLTASGHEVVCCVHDVAQSKRRFPNLQALPCNFVHDTTFEIWVNRLKDLSLDAVVNCVGILQANDPKVIEAIHDKTPRALVTACKTLNIQKFVHISALGADENVDTPYAQTKYAFEMFLKDFNYNWIILRPSLIYASGSYGGTSLFRALAAIPFVIPIVGQGKQLFQPIYIKDLAKTVKIILENAEIKQMTINVVGPDTISIENLLVILRQWLGFPKAKILHIPLKLIRLGAYLGDWFKDIPINSTSYKMLSYNNIADIKPFIDVLGFKPGKLQDNLMENPSSTQDRWHARLYFLNPLLRITLGFTWLLSGLIPLLSSKSIYIDLFSKIGITGTSETLFFYGSTLLDILLGILTLANWKLKWVGSLQCLLIIVYTIIISLFMPEYWLDPFGAILKNIPLLVATLMMIALEDPR